MVAASALDVRSNAQVFRPVAFKAPSAPKAQNETLDTYQAARPQVNRQGAVDPAKFNFGEAAANAMTFGFFFSFGNALFRCCWPF